ncbi:conserved hypothetical protein [Rippkaea orientalis PCC 8801]|uniref:DUF4336 domain-containing protein n=1 Tax=Rippkaea orientalis (strain PCC 8801 / RF-1) TaxID=41431 RepID=B7K0M6_RIPO1|nr:DUF4336 domain-containing protein [Rippkaea orientalis]ACK64180.1 conserved hypothetical protein [Rippkaea orientalis PCC 8801]
MDKVTITSNGDQYSQSIPPQDLSWPFWPVVPLYPYGRRRTLRQEVVKDTIWTFDQLQGILYVVVPIRMTVIKLQSGGLLVYAPVAPTPECIRLVNELVAQHGEVKYIILPTVSGIEHKVFAGPFARCFPRSQVFVAPHQWSFPLNLPLSWLGLPWGRTQILPLETHQTPFADEFDYRILGPINLGVGPFVEVAFFHKRSQTLLVTDSVISVPLDPPEIVQLNPYPLLFHARDSALEIVDDTKEIRRKGWQRIVLFSLYFRPGALQTIEWGKVLKDALKAPNRSLKAYLGLFPFQWNRQWQKSFEILNKQNLLVAPILQGVIFNRDPLEVLTWVDQVSKWGFKQIIPCHFQSPIEANGSEFREGFDFLRGKNQPLPTEDLALIKNIDNNLTRFRITPPGSKNQ